MGCCSSRASDEPAPGVLGHSSSRNIIAPSTRPNSIPSPRHSHASHSHAQPSPTRADVFPNTPLKPIPPAQRSRLPNTLASPPAKSSRRRVKPLSDPTTLIWTRSRLLKERVDWWDTQVTGSLEIWGAIRLAAQYLQAAELEEAQTMLDVTGCTCPTGLLWKGVYDATGVQYKVPEWIIVEPDDLVDETDAQGTSAPAPGSPVPGLSLAKASDGEGNDVVESILVRTSHDSRDITISVRQNEAVTSIIEKIKQATKIDTHSDIRLAYGGRIYKNSDTLEANQYWSYANNYIVTALVRM